MNVLRVVIKSMTASFRYPTAISGTQITLPVPPYTTILGLISCCSGKLITSSDTQIGFEFSFMGKSKDLERFHRWDYNVTNPGKPRLNPDGPAVRNREFLLNPKLILYLTNTDLKDSFLYPKGIPTLGRSQDIAWIESIEEIELKSVRDGLIGGTLIPVLLLKNNLINGLMLRLPEEMSYDERNLMRSPKPYTHH